MRVLVVEDDFTSRRLLSLYLAPYGECDVAVDGHEALEAFRMALEEKQPYDVICLDIMMPNMDGHEALKRIRALEEEHGVLLGEGVKIIMTTALGDSKNIFKAFNEQCEAYLVKPIEQEKLAEELKKLGLA